MGWELETHKRITCYTCMIRIKNGMKRTCMLVQGLIWTVELHLWTIILTWFLGLWFFDNYRSKTGFLSVENVKIADRKKLNQFQKPITIIYGRKLTLVLLVSPWGLASITAQWWSDREHSVTGPDRVIEVQFNQISTFDSFRSWIELSSVTLSQRYLETFFGIKW